MKNIFIVLGYGIPKNIIKDENYSIYLNTIFNRTYQITCDNGIIDPVIICSGGKTDLFKPYKRSEAEEMVKLLKKLSQRPKLKNITKNWQYIPEAKSLSTLENLQNINKILKDKKIIKANLYIFGEQTRIKRIEVLSNKLFSKNCRYQIIPIDFDVSTSRYDPESIKKREEVEMEFSLFALKSSKNMKKYHEIYVEKFKLLRKSSPKDYLQVRKLLREMKIKEINK